MAKEPGGSENEQSGLDGLTEQELIELIKEEEELIVESFARPEAAEGRERIKELYSEYKKRTGIDYGKAAATEQFKKLETEEKK
jgi:hypothetical protein